MAILLLVAMLIQPSPGSVASASSASGAAAPTESAIRTNVHARLPDGLYRAVTKAEGRAAPTLAPGPQVALSIANSSSLGERVALSGDGRIALVGARDANSRGAAYLFVEPAGGWAVTQSPTAVFSDPTNFFFGSAVALSGDGSIAAVAGACGRCIGKAPVDIFTEPSGGWATTSTPTASLWDPSADSEFGDGMALSEDGSTVLAGDPSKEIADIFTAPAAGWGTTAPAMATLSVPGTSFFGVAVALDSSGSTALIGSPDGTGAAGAAYIFSKPSGPWFTTSSPAATLMAPGSGELGWGAALSDDGVYALVGAPSTNSSTGEAYIFEEPVIAWDGPASPIASLAVTGLPSNSLLGTSVSLSGAGDLALVGAPGTNSNVGAGYLFRMSSNGWASGAGSVDTLATSGTSDFGRSVAVSGDGSLTVVGAPSTSPGGVAYVQYSSERLFVNASSGNDGNDCRVPTSNGAGLGPCLTINGALAQAGPGATIIVTGATGGFNGVYCEQLVVPFSLHLQADTSAPLPVIDGGGANTACSSAPTPGPVVTVSPGQHLSLVSVTLQHGTGTGQFTPSGGGIQNTGGALYLSAVTVTANSATGAKTACIGQTAHGGGIDNENEGSGRSRTGLIFLDDSTVTGNSAQGGAGNAGGNCQNGTAGGSAAGGGIENAGMLFLRTSTVSNNTAIGGASVFSAGPTGAGGGIENIGSLWITASTIGPNNVAAGGAGDSTFAGGAGSGGGIDSSGSDPATLTNSTIAGNTAKGGVGGGSQGPGGTAGGGALSSSHAAYTLINTTIAVNAATGGSGGGPRFFHGPPGAGTGGGIAATSGITGADLTNTILAKNTASTSDPDCSAVLADGTFTVGSGTVPAGHNILGDESASCSGLTNSTHGDKIGTDTSPLDPKLNANGLQNNGGPTQTIALQTGADSPAIGAGDYPACAGASIDGYDQRGRTRNATARQTCDVGAYDSGQGLTLRLTAPGTAAAGHQFPVTVTAFNATDGTQATGYAGTVHFTSSDFVTMICMIGCNYAFTDVDAGSHSFNLSIDDAGQQTLTVKDITSGVSSSAPILVGVSIAPGWNLINLPLASMGVTGAAGLVACMDGSSASTCAGGRVQLGAGAISGVATYARGRFQLYVPNYSAALPIGANPANQGIFVLSRASGAWLPAGSPYSSGQTISFSSGWNLVAIPFPRPGMSPTTIATDATACNAQEIAVYDPASTPNYATWVPGDTSSFTVHTYQGVWMLCSGGGSWTT